MGFMDSLNVSASGMTAERVRMDVISNNLANANTTRTSAGGPFRRQEVMLAPGQTSFSDALQAADGTPGAVSAAGNGLNGVEVSGIVADQSPFKEVYDPGNPDADKRGYIKLPNVNVVSEMVDMMTASRAYEADVTSVNAAKAMAMKALDIGKA